jgi:hypothetical protein
MTETELIAPAANEGMVTELVEAIRPLLAGRPPEIQAAVLADLLAIWLAGHQVEGDIAATRAVRSELLAQHLCAVRCLVEFNAKIMGTTASVGEDDVAALLGANP